MTSKNWEDLDITQDELERITTALKNDEFKKMFFEYCEEVQNPENKKKYEEEITQLEAERGVDITFLNPDPGFVVKTSVDGKMKCFINIAKSDKVEKPTNEVGVNEETGRRGVSWRVPYAQAPPRDDYDKKCVKCIVYDVLFHPLALQLAEKNPELKKYLITTACDAIEREYKVKLDRTNLRFPKLKFKGLAKPTVIRKLSENPPEPMGPSPLDEYYPPLPKEGKDSEPKVYTSHGSANVEKYNTPKYIIKHRRDVDMAEMTYELDAKLNVTVPKELIVEIELPLLKSTADCNLDVTSQQLFLISEKPAKYKLCVDLPYPVNDKEGSAKFDQDTRKLTVVLPVCNEKEKNLKDLCREDSGVESDIKEDNSSPTPDSNPLVEVIESEDFVVENSNEIEQDNIEDNEQFLKDTIKYNFPGNFDCNTLDENLAFTLHVKNVDPQSLKYIKGEKFVHFQFISLGSGHYPVYYAFYAALPENSPASITNVEAEAWDNNVILTIALKDYEDLQNFLAGLDAAEVKEYQIMEQFSVASKKFSSLHEDEIDISIKASADQVQIDILPSKENNSIKKDNEVSKDNKKTTSKRQKKRNKKRRSLSESSCDYLISSAELDTSVIKSDSENKSDAEIATGRKVRSLSESRDSEAASLPKDFKGILKHRSRYGRSMSESWSSIDENSSYSCSLEFSGGSFNNIPEEDDAQQQNLSESCKKTVRFSDVIKKQLFRLDSSILGQRKKNQKKKNQKLRALQRRNSEGDSMDYEDKSTRISPLLEQKASKIGKHDSGLDLTEIDDSLASEKDKDNSISMINSESLDMECKNSLMFDIEM